MTRPIINILIRSHGNRPYEKAVMSVFNENYPGARVWIHHDQEGPRSDYSYNGICNEMKAKVKEGWFFFLDSDDTLIPGALWRLSEHLKDNNIIICQFLRNGLPKPSDKEIANREVKVGRIGLPCIVVPALFNEWSLVAETEDGDWRYIKGHSGLKKFMIFLPLPLVDSPKRGHGR